MRTYVWNLTDHIDDNRLESLRTISIPFSRKILKLRCRRKITQSTQLRQVQATYPEIYQYHHYQMANLILVIQLMQMLLA